MEGTQDQQAIDVISNAQVNSENVNSMKPGLIRFESQLHSKMPSIEESCRQALEKAPSLRTPLEVQGIQAWMLTSGFKETKELQSFSQEELEKLCSFVTLAQYPIHHTLYRQGDAIDAFYFVFSGLVQLQVKQTTAFGVVAVIVRSLRSTRFWGSVELLQKRREMRLRLSRLCVSL